MPEWMQIVRDFGLPTGLVIYMMWRDYQRDQRANRKEDETTMAFKELNQRQYDLAEKCIEAVTISNELKRELKVVLEHMDMRLDGRRGRASGGFGLGGQTEMEDRL